MSIYGIDLGTTNSLIGNYDMNYLSDLIPSCVDLETGEAGVTQFENMKAKRSFKINMSMGTEGLMPRTASKYVLQEIKRNAPGIVKDVVISVPAYFSDSQRTATKTAAEQARLNVRGLVNEPTAAAMYIARDKKGLFIVFDLGGGTFDCTIIDSRFGAFDVQATDGCTIGGDNFDNNLMKHVMSAAHLRIQQMTPTNMTALKHYCAKMKIQLQKDKHDVTMDLTQWGGTSNFKLTVENYKSLMKVTFGETINCMKRLTTKWLPENEMCEVLLVGGSTHCPYLREWIQEETSYIVAPITYDPDRVVAQGAAFYAHLMETGEIQCRVSDVTKALGVGVFDGTVQNIIPANSKIPLTMEKMFTNVDDTDRLELKLFQGSALLQSDNDLIGTLYYDYECVQPANMGQVIVTIEIDDSGIISFSANELLKPKKTMVIDRSEK